MIPPWLRLTLLTGLAVAVGAWLWINFAGDEPEDWHVDPATVERPATPNDYMVAPAGAVAAEPDRPAPVWDLTPDELFALIDHHALAQPRTRRIGGGPFDLHATYVARSRFWGFPDYITVKTLPAEGGATLILWSRARYGYGDMGVNKTRAEAWIAALPDPVR